MIIQPACIPKTFGRIADCHKILGRPFLDKNIIIEAVIPVENGHKAHHLRAVWNVIWCIT